MTSCETIDENDRLVVDDKIPERPEVERKILLEEFTGIFCSNCPEATAIAHDIQKNLGDQLVIVSLHAGDYARPYQGFDLASEAAKFYHDYFYTENQRAYPSAMFSRVKRGSSYVEANPLIWETLVNNRLQEDFLDGREFSFIIRPEYSEEDNSIVVRTTIETIDPLSGVKLQLWLTESKIEGFQIGSGVVYQDYVHNHILRDAINGYWGDDISSIPEGSTYEMVSEAYTMKDDAWKPENMNVVAFIYDEKTMEVLDVIEMKLIEE